MIRRTWELRHLEELLAGSPIVAILGARQVGKTTLAKQFSALWKGPVVHFDLELPRDMARLGEATLTLEKLRGLVVLDEIQRLPSLFPILRVLADRPRRPARFLLLGSASPGLIRGASESLAGRVAFMELGGLSVDDVGAGRLDQLWLRGGFPRSFLARTASASAAWRRDFIRTFLERDIPQLGIGVAAATLHRFWTMIAHYHAQLWNGAELARSLGVAESTVRRYLDLLTATYVLRSLRPWHENLAKRQVKAPKVYLADTGLLHTLLEIESISDLEGHPKCGASWEGFALAAVVRQLRARWEECYFWRTHTGAEIDLLVVRGRKRLGFEFKRTDAPAMSRSMHIALEDLRLSRLSVIHAGDHTFPLGSLVRAIPLARVFDEIEPA